MAFKNFFLKSKNWVNQSLGLKSVNYVLNRCVRISPQACLRDGTARKKSRNSR